MSRILLFVLIFPLIAVGYTNAANESDSHGPEHRYRLKSMKVTSSYEPSQMTLSFSYDSIGNLSSERIVKKTPDDMTSGYDNYDVTYHFEYADDELLMKIGDRVLSRGKLENGNLTHKSLKYRNGRLVSEKFKNFIGVDPDLDGCDKCVFNWNDVDVESISFYKGSQFLGDLTYNYRNEKCNSVLVYVHTYNMIYVPSAFCYECLSNHAAMFHSGLLTPTRLIESYQWPDGTAGRFKYVFDSNGNPETVVFESMRFGDEKYTITEECQWEEY